MASGSRCESKRSAVVVPAHLQSSPEFFVRHVQVALRLLNAGVSKHQLDDPVFPHLTYRRGARGAPVAVLRGTGLRVQTVVVAAQTWGLSPTAIAAEYDLAVAQVEEALAFAAAHRDEIDAALAAEDAQEAEAHGTPTPPS